jgi:hypothetical protein
MNNENGFTVENHAPDSLRKIAGALHALADALEDGTARYVQGAIEIDMKAQTFDEPTNDGRVRTVTGKRHHGFPQGTVMIRSDAEFLTGQPPCQTAKDVPVEWRWLDQRVRWIKLSGAPLRRTM